MGSIPQAENTLAIRFGRAKNIVAVDSFKSASEAWCKLRSENELSGSNSPKVTVIDLATMKTVAWISYNGRVWSGKYGSMDKEIAL